MQRASSSSTQSPPATHASRVLTAIPSLPCSRQQHRMLRVSTGHTHKLLLTFFFPLEEMKGSRSFQHNSRKILQRAS